MPLSFIFVIAHAVKSKSFLQQLVSIFIFILFLQDQKHNAKTPHRASSFFTFQSSSCNVFKFKCRPKSRGGMPTKDTSS